MQTHRKVAEGLIGRSLTKDDHVHHKDGNRKNNNINNLEVLTQVEHQSRHPNGGILRRKTNKGNPLLAWCSSCKQFKDKKDFSKNKTHWNGVGWHCKPCCSILDKIQYDKSVERAIRIRRERDEMLFLWR
jgi:hypothetical protein